MLTYSGIFSGEESPEKNFHLTLTTDCIYITISAGILNWYLLIEWQIPSYCYKHQGDYPNSYLKMSFMLANLPAALLSISVY